MHMGIQVILGITLLTRDYLVGMHGHSGVVPGPKANANVCAKCTSIHVVAYQV